MKPLLVTYYLVTLYAHSLVGGTAAVLPGPPAPFAQNVILILLDQQNLFLDKILKREICENLWKILIDTWTHSAAVLARMV